MAGTRRAGARQEGRGGGRASPSLKDTGEERRPANGATILDVAREAGVSSATAGRVLGGYGYSSEKTRTRVLKAAEQLGYRPNQLARSMATGRTFTIGVVIADIENLFFARATRAISDAARAHGFNVILANTDEDIELERDAVRVFLDKRVDGLIVAPTSSIHTAHLEAAQQAGCPVVLLDRRVPALGADTLAVDNFRAAHEAVSHLIRRGHTRIALASNAPANDRHLLISSIRERIDGYRNALVTAGLPYSDDLVLLGGWNPTKPGRDLSKIASPTGFPTAFLATDSLVALGLLRMLRDSGLAVPQRVSLISFDDAEWTTAIEPALTVVCQPVRALGVAATETLIDRITGNETGPPREQLLLAELVLRDSVAQVIPANRGRGMGRKHRSKVVGD